MIGAAVVWFLIVTGVDHAQSSKLNREIVKYSDQIAAKNAEISALKKELEGYRDSSDDVEAAKETAESTKESYETLLTLEAGWSSNSKSDADLVENLLKINQEALGSEAKELYKKIHDDVAPRVCKKQYKAAKQSFEEGNYEDAIKALVTVTSLEEGYDDGQALLLLVQSYQKAGKEEDYKAAYEKAKELFPDALAKMEQEAKQEEDAQAENAAAENTDAENADAENDAEETTQETE